MPLPKWPFSRSVPILVCALLVAGTLTAGCSQVTVVTRLHQQELSLKGQPLAHVHASNWGLYLFNLFPIVSGDTSTPGNIRFFSDEVTVDKLVEAVTQKSRSLGGTITSDLTSHENSRWSEVGLLFWTRTVEVSGNCVKAHSASGTKTTDPATH